MVATEQPTSRRTSPKHASRKSVTLDEQDKRDLAALRRSKDRLDLLSRLAATEVTQDSSEAVVLHAVVSAGIKAVEEASEAEGYKEVARQMDGPARKAVARRRRPTWADE